VQILEKHNINDHNIHDYVTTFLWPFGQELTSVVKSPKTQTARTQYGGFIVCSGHLSASFIYYVMATKYCVK